MWAYPRVIAHRCGGALAPENTLAGLRVAARMGVKAVEFDVMLSADGIPVLIHDDTLERTTDGQGIVAQHTLEALQTFDAGAKHHRAFAGERIPTLAQALTLCDELGLAVNLEIKPAPGHDEATGATAAALAAAMPLKAGILLSSFSPLALTAAKGIEPELPRALLVEQIPADWREQMVDCRALHVSRTADRERMREVVAAGVPLACYTVNEPVEAEALLALGVSAVFSDRPDRFAFL